MRGLLAVPELSRFYCVKFTMNFVDDAPPHFHATYGEDEAQIDIATGSSRSAAMNCPAIRIRDLGSHRLEILYADGLSAVLDFANFLANHDGPVVEPLRDERTFSTVRLEHGVVTWPNGFDICPDVLRFWSEQGRVCSDDETNTHFESQRPLLAS